MNMLLIIASLVLAAIICGFIWGGEEAAEIRRQARQASFDQPNPRGDLR